LRGVERRDSKAAVGCSNAINASLPA
jgi:hypothetical protein